MRAPFPHPLRSGLGALLVCLLAACSEAPQPGRSDSTQADTPPVLARGADSWMADVVAMAAADGNAGRREVIRARLDALGLQWRNQHFTVSGEAGENILAGVSGSAEAPLLLLGAHSDRVDVGRGATDNASGSATVLALARRLKQQPLAHHRVALAFWDLEEKGLLGAQAYLDNRGEAPALYVNFDVLGWGDTLWMMAPDADHPLLAAVREATQIRALGLRAGGRYPPSDYRPFLQADLPAVSFALVDAQEIAPILDAYAGNPPAPMPKLMQVIHNERDTVAEIDPAATALAVDAIEAALRQWDGGLAGAADAAVP
ncbi:MAG: Zn-dependent exopeptidase M28 [Proteobacteria bacterium]|nr:Zn-dependent exopeptidase M28 [Pseudomonadota bacterium]